jgi:hypothetical protein
MVNPRDIEASSSGRVSAAFQVHGMEEDTGPYPFFIFNRCPWKFLHNTAIANRSNHSKDGAKQTQHKGSIWRIFWWYVYWLRIDTNLYPSPADRVSAEEMFEEEDDPQADSDVTFDDASSDLNPPAPHPVIYSTSEYPNTTTITQETGERSQESQQPFTFGNGSDIYGEMGVRFSHKLLYWRMTALRLRLHRL